MSNNFQDGWLQLDGMRFHYTEWGSRAAPPLLMLHGLNVQCHTWDPFARVLADDYYVICMDLRGHGDSDWSRAGYRVQSFARDVHNFIDALGVGPVHLVGHSNGVRVGDRGRRRKAGSGPQPCTVGRGASKLTERCNRDA